jgi:hypothetical protein
LRSITPRQCALPTTDRDGEGTGAELIQKRLAESLGGAERESAANQLAVGIEHNPIGG